MNSEDELGLINFKTFINWIVFKWSFKASFLQRKLEIIYLRACLLAWGLLRPLYSIEWDKSLTILESLLVCLRTCGPAGYLNE